MLSYNFGVRGSWAQDYDELFVKRSLMFSDIMKIETREYEEIVDLDRLVKKIVEFQDDYNMEF